MGNNRVFDYTEIGRIYGEMNTITGNSSDPTSIAGLLHKINEEYTELVNGTAGEDELALKGDAASDLKNSWDNTVSDHFAKFVENFGAWASVVAASAGDYTQFEQAVQGIRTANPLGWNSGGAADSASATGFYSNALTEQEIADLAAQAQFYQLTGATYVDTGMVSYAEKKKVWNTVNTVLAVGSFASAGFSLIPRVAHAISGVKALGTVATAIKGTKVVSAVSTAAKTVGGAIAGTKAFSVVSPVVSAAVGFIPKVIPAVSAVSGAAATISGWIDPDYDASKYMTGNLEVPVTVGGTRTINGSDYTFVGSSANGTNIYYDSNKNMVYEDSNGNLQTVTNSSGQPATYVAGGNTVINAGNEVIGPQNTLRPNYVKVNNETKYDDYYDTLSNLSSTATEWLNENNGSQAPEFTESPDTTSDATTSSGQYTEEGMI